MLSYGSVCSGIEAASVAWHPLGWRAAFLSEIEAFPRAVLAHHYPEVPLHGDFTTIRAGEYAPIDLLVGGTPCQSFSVAGLRGGLDDERGNLALEYLRLADRLRPRWLVWENVPGVLSSNGGRDFGAFLGGLVELGYGFAYRVLDAQFFGVAQRRRRVFVVGHLGDWRRAAAVLFERHSLQGHPAPRREAGPGVAALTANGVGTCGADDNQGQAGHLIATSLRARDLSRGVDSDCTDTLIASTLTRTYGEQAGQDFANDGMLVAHALRAEGFDASEDGTGRGTPLVPVAFTCSDQANSFAWERLFAPTISAQVPNDTSNLQTGVRIGSAVRRLTPVECERLQGFPDNYTAIPYRGKPAADGPRYKALGNSMAVPVMAHIGRRIQMVEDLCARLEQADAA
jgi:DNA (cytosine-5)-methyltransferase 1